MISIADRCKKTKMSMELKRIQETNRQNEASKLPETRENAGGKEKNFRSLLVLYLTGWKIGSRFFQTKYGRVQ